MVRTYFDATFSWTTASYIGNRQHPGATVYTGARLRSTRHGVARRRHRSNANDGAVAGGSLGVYYAFIQFAGFTMGKAVSQFDAPWTNYPGNNFDGLVGGGGTVTGVNQFTYTAQFGNGVSAALSAQDQTAYYQAGISNLTRLRSPPASSAARYGANDIGGTRSPDLVAYAPRRPGLGSVPGVGRGA